MGAAEFTLSEYDTETLRRWMARAEVKPEEEHQNYAAILKIEIQRRERTVAAIRRTSVPERQGCGQRIGVTRLVCGALADHPGPHQVEIR